MTTENKDMELHFDWSKFERDQNDEIIINQEKEIIGLKRKLDVAVDALTKIRDEVMSQYLNSKSLLQSKYDHADKAMKEIEEENKPKK